MIAMSNDFKSSISNPIRQMKGYVEIEYTDSTAKDNASVSNCPQILKIGNDFLSDEVIIDDDRKGKNYASLEEDYFRLDGTFVLPNNVADKNPGIGYVSNLTFEDDQEIKFTPFQISTSFEEGATVNGLTMYFQNNNPLTLEIQVTSGTDVETFTEEDCTISSNGVVQLTFSDRQISFLRIYVNDVLYPNRRLRLQEIDFGLSAIYENEDLISFKTTEQCNRFGYELPINECDIILGNFNGIFDSINPKGITQYLTEDVVIKPFVGVVTDENGIEYCEQGWYWLSEYEYDNKQVTLKCKGFLNKLQQQTYQLNDSDLPEYLNRIGLDVTFWSTLNNGINNTGAVRMGLLKLGTGLDAITKYQVFYSTPLVEMKQQSFYKDLTNQKQNYHCIYLYSKIGQIYKTINLSNLKEYPKITALSKVKNISIKEYQYSEQSSSDEVLYETSLNCEGETELVYDYQKPTGTKTYIICDNYSNLTILDARNHIYDKNDNLIYTPDYGGTLLEYSYAKINFVGNLTFKVVRNIDYKEEVSENIIHFNEVGEEISIDNEMISGTDSRKLSNYLGNYINENKSKNSISFNFNGDPTIELGDSIEVENKYPDENGNIKYDKVWVTKIESEFKGSFSQSIEGDIIE